MYQDELRRSSSGDLLTALQHLRPGWFRRSPSLLSGATPGALLVYLDGVLLGGSGTLRQISVASVLAAHYLSPPEAEAAFGPGALYGAISVSTVSH